MKLVDTYLTDEELEQLILEVEENELVAAPPGLLQKILADVDASEDSNVVKDVSGMQEDNSRQRIQEKKRKEFRTYCFRVLTSVAAAILIIFALPSLMDAQLPDVPTRQDIIVPKEYPTKEEVLREDSILQKAFGGNHIFNNDSELNIFK